MRSKAIESKAYWTKHVEAHKASGLNKHKYCDQHKVSYHRFLYWFNKLNKKSNQFIKIKLNPESEQTAHSAKTLCVLEFKQGHRLLVHNEAVLAKVLSICKRLADF